MKIYHARSYLQDCAINLVRDGRAVREHIVSSNI